MKATDTPTCPSCGSVRVRATQDVLAPERMYCAHCHHLWTEEPGPPLEPPSPAEEPAAALGFTARPVVVTGRREWYVYQGQRMIAGPFPGSDAHKEASARDRAVMLNRQMATQTGRPWPTSANQGDNWNPLTRFRAEVEAAGLPTVDHRVAESYIGPAARVHSIAELDRLLGAVSMEVRVTFRFPDGSRLVYPAV